MKKVISLILMMIIVICMLGIQPIVLAKQETKTKYDSIIDFSKQQLNITKTEVPKNLFPRNMSISDQKWHAVKASDWTSGFFPGLLWYIYQYTGDISWKNEAIARTQVLDAQKYNNHTHDIGFMMFDSFGNGYRLTKSQQYKKTLLTSARTLASRYNPKVGCIRSWDKGSWKYPVIIDNMMNTELLFWAAKNGGSNDLYKIALSHCLKTAKNHVRADGSTYHVVDYNPANGKVISKCTAQGYANESVWSRGQAWAIYGFTMAYRYTKDERMLETAIKVSNYYINNLPEDYVPYWDFKAPHLKNEEKDTSAAAIAASGLFELSGYVKGNESERYRRTAVNTIKSLASPAYLAKGTQSHGILLHSVGSHPDGQEIDNSIIYTDYYFVESLVKYKIIIAGELKAPPIAAFTVSPNTGKAPLTVTFKDKSTNNPVSWSWNFGDKSISTVQNPVHQYAKAGKFTVKLTVKNFEGNNWVIKKSYVNVK
jgi:FOG: PKD repeat